MVYFTCNNCGASLKKNSVDKHKGQCRHPLALTCVDCHKDFYGQDYVAHTKCITEDEKYSAKGFQSRPSSNKGELKQQSWIEIVHYVNDASKNLSYEERQLFNSLVKHDNIPQKKQKFQNFTTNIWPAAKYNPHIVNRIWDLLDAENKSRKEKIVTGSNTVVDLPVVQKNEAEDSNESVVDTETNVPEKEMNIDKEVVDEKLTKKEKKSKRKREKYEAELTEVNTVFANDSKENSGNKDVDEDDEALEKMSKKERKKKKLKNAESEANSVKNIERKSKKKNCVQNGENETEESEARKEVETPDGEGKSKKKRKIKQEEILNLEPSKKKMKANGNGTNSAAIEDDPVTSSKFNWTEIILKVLENTEDKELLVKRLRKKVLSEYEATIEGSEIDVKIIAKFNKKLSKTPGVVVLKDRAKLKC